MIRIHQICLFVLFSYSFVFCQEEERNAHVSLKIKNDLGEVFEGTILLVANEDTIPITASWDNSFRTDLLPGEYRFILKHKLFDDYQINSLFLGTDETQNLDIVLKHKIFIFPNKREPICIFPVLPDN